MTRGGCSLDGDFLRPALVTELRASIAVTRRLSVAIVVAATIALSARNAAMQTPVFKTGAMTVSVNAAVKRGNRVVANLTAKDFRLTDNASNRGSRPCRSNPCPST